MKNVILTVLQGFNSIRSVKIFIMQFVLVSLCFSSCKRGDEEPPVLSLSILDGNTNYNYNETISFSVSATDNEGIESLVVLVLSSNGSSVLDSKNFSTGNSGNYSSQAGIEHNNRYLNSGTYLLKAIASDGENETVAFREVYLYALPKAIERIFLFQSIDEANMRIDSLNLNGNSSIAQTLDIGLDVAACNSFDATILIGGREFEGLTSLDPYSMNVMANLPTPANQSLDYFNDILYDEDAKDHFLSTRDGLIRVVSGDAVLKNTLSSSPFIPGKMALYEDYLLVLEKSVNGFENRISTFNRNTGALLQSTFLNFEPQAILAQSSSGNNEIWLVGNQDESAISRVFNVVLNTVYDPNGILELNNSSAIIWAEILPDGRPVISQANGTFVYSSDFSGTGIQIGNTASQIVLEPLNGLIFLVEDGQVIVVNATTLNAIQSFPTLSGLRQLSVLYNK